MNDLSPASIHALGSPLSVVAEVHEVLDSTQNRARELARRGAPHGTLVVAGIQTGGRGRLRRQWGSPRGGLWMSLVLRPDLETSVAPRITQTAAVAVAKTIRELGVDAGIKWPNDILVEPGGKKICGILAESSPRRPASGQTPRVDHVLLGIGLNANLDPGDLDVTDRGITTLRAELCRDVDVRRLVDRLLSSLDSELRRIHDFDAILDDWRALSPMLGRRVCVRRSAQVLEGIAVDISPEGALLLRTTNGMVEVNEGEVERVGAVPRK